MTTGAAASLARAEAFVRGRGDALAQARLDVFLGKSPEEALTPLLELRRCPRGGFAGGASEPVPTLPGALALLEILDEAGLRSGSLAEAAAVWLARAQSGDGSWRSGESGDDGVLVTGHLLGQLAKLRCGSPRTLERAAAFLDAAFTPERVEQGGPGAVLAFALPATNGALERADEVLQWCGRSLEKGLRSGAIDVPAALRTLLVCDARSLPGARVEATALVLMLLSGQAPDGGFGAPGDPTPDRVEDTLLAVRALRRFPPSGAGGVLPG